MIFSTLLNISQHISLFFFRHPCSAEVLRWKGYNRVCEEPPAAEQQEDKGDNGGVKEEQHPPAPPASVWINGTDVEFIQTYT